MRHGCRSSGSQPNVITTRLRRPVSGHHPRDVLHAWQGVAAGVLGLPEPLWSVPACAAVVEATLDGPDPVPAVRRFARQRAVIGFTLDETVVDLGVLAGLDRRAAAALDRLEIGTAVADAHTTPESERCTDPLTGLVSRPYLASRLAEAQRHAWSLHAAPSAMFHLLVYRLAAPLDVAHAMANALTASDALQRTFVSGETVAAVSARVFAVLRATAPLRTVEGLPESTVQWVERMPDNEEGLRALLAELR